jgi:cytochrome c553
MISANSTQFRLYLTLAAMILIAGCTAAMMREEPAYASSTASDGSSLGGTCPLPRETSQAPQSYYLKQNPLAATPDNIEKGKRLYVNDARPVSCANCHGLQGDGQGPTGKHLQPPPTDFTCKALMDTLPDGQLFWIIENGSGLFELAPGHSRETIKRPGRRPRYTAMRGHKNELTEEQIWQLVLYIRTFSY